MFRLAALLLLAALVGGASAAGRSLTAAAAGKGLQAPCFVPATYYPFATCAVSQDSTICGRGFNAWTSMADCCAIQKGPLGAFKGGCSDLSKNVTCFVAGAYHPTQTCGITTDPSICVGRNWGRWATQDECCLPGRAFSAGCTKMSACWAASDWYPERKCKQFTEETICLRGWGAFATEGECCAPNGAHSEGCGVVAGVKQN